MKFDIHGKSLRISGYIINQEKLQRILDLIASNDIEKISFSGCHFRDDFIEHKSMWLAATQNLLTLKLNSCYLQEMASYIVAESLTRNMASLTLISTPLNVQAFNLAITTASALKEFTIACINLELPEQATALSTLLTSNPGLQRFTLTSSTISLNTIHQIESALNGNQTLKYLNLLGNKLDTYYLPFLLKIMKNTQIETIDLSANRFTEQDIDQIVNTIRTFNLTHIKSINLNRNRIKISKPLIEKLNDIIHQNQLSNSNLSFTS